MSSLAHEGNPKEDSITITGGSVLSTAQLDINFSFTGGVNPTFPNPTIPPSVAPGCVNREETREIEQCELGLRVIDRYDYGSYIATDKLHGSFVGCSGTPAGGFVFQPTTPLFNIEVVSGRDDLTVAAQGIFAGFSLVEGVINASHVGDFLSAYTLYNLVQGFPRVGFCFWVDIESTPCDFTGCVAINDPADNRTYVGYFINANLHIDDPVIVATGTVCPTNQVLNFFHDVSAGTFELSKTSGLLLSTSLSSVVPNIIDNQPNWGLIWLPNEAQGAHRATFGYGFSPWDIS